MNLYTHALKIDESSSQQDLESAIANLNLCETIILILEGQRIALRPTTSKIYCEVVDTNPMSHRCAEEFKVMVENAKRSLTRSKLANHLPNKPRQWLVVEECNGHAEELWLCRAYSKELYVEL